MRTASTLATAIAAVLALPAAALADTTQDYRATITQANGSGASAAADLALSGNDLTVRITGEGFFDGFPHAIHLHGEPGGDNVCGPLNPGDPGFEAADEDGDGFLSVVEGVPSYGGVTVSLTTEGDTSPDSALAVDRFPTSGTIDYERTFQVSDEVAQNLSTLHIVIHGADLDGSGEIGTLTDANGDPKPSSLDPELPFEATAVAACGQVLPVAAGGVDTGAGGTAPTTAPTTTATTGVEAGVLLAGVVGLGALALVTARRRALEG
jgi:opacity protein-like surface antigen